MQNVDSSDTLRSLGKTSAGPGRAGAAGRRRARVLPGRRLPGAARSRHRAGLDHRHLDRRHQCQPDRRQRAAATAWRACRNSGSGWSRARSGAFRDAFPGLQRASCPTGRPSRTAFPASSGPTRWPHAGDAYPLGAEQRRLLFDGAAARRRWASSSISSWSIAARRGSPSAPPMCAPARCAISTAATARSTSSTSWPPARCRRRFRPSASTASSIGTAAFCRTRRPRRCSTTIRARIR